MPAGMQHLRTNQFKVFVHISLWKVVKIFIEISEPLLGSDQKIFS